jgi:hypothetical protein
MLPALALLAAGFGAKYKATRDAGKHRDRLRGAMEGYQRGQSNIAMKATEDMLQHQTPQARAAEFAGEERKISDSMAQTVGAARAHGAPAVAGAHSADFREASEKSASSVAERVRRAIEQMSTMRAPGAAGLNHSMRFGRAAGTVDGANQASANVGRAFLTDIDNVQPDPKLMLLGDVAMTAGGGMLGAPAAPLSLRQRLQMSGLWSAH